MTRRPITNDAEYQATLEFMRELMRTQDVEQEPFKSAWARAGNYAAAWKAEHDSWVIEQPKRTSVSFAFYLGAYPVDDGMTAVEFIRDLRDED
jgi:hypothetical protein